MKKILIAYESKSGSTKSVAKFIGKELKAKGFETDVKTASQVEFVSGYDLVIIGAPVNGMQWLPEAAAFVNKHKEELNKLPVACFLLAVVLNGGRKFFVDKIPGVFKPVEKVITPVKKGFFGGCMKGKPPFILRLIFGLTKDTKPDGRNWDEITAWVNELVEITLKNN